MPDPATVALCPACGGWLTVQGGVCLRCAAATMAAAVIEAKAQPKRVYPWEIPPARNRRERRARAAMQRRPA